MIALLWRLLVVWVERWTWARRYERQARRLARLDAAATRALYEVDVEFAIEMGWERPKPKHVPGSIVQFIGSAGTTGLGAGDVVLGSLGFDSPARRFRERAINNLQQQQQLGYNATPTGLLEMLSVNPQQRRGMQARGMLGSSVDHLERMRALQNVAMEEAAGLQQVQQGQLGAMRRESDALRAQRDALWGAITNQGQRSDRWCPVGERLDSLLAQRDATAAALARVEQIQQDFRKKMFIPKGVLHRRPR